MACVSMTGFGTARATHERVEVVVEIRTVNHRHLDTNIRIPPVYTQHESGLVKILRDTLRRGRVDVNISRNVQAQAQGECRLNVESFQAYLKQYADAFSLVQSDWSKHLSDIVLAVLQRREVLEFVSPESSVEAEGLVLEKCFRDAVTQLQEMRKVEGKALEKEVSQLLSHFEGFCNQISTLVPATVTQLREKLLQRLEKLMQGVTVDPHVVAQEVAVIADRTDVTEELARLQSHIAQFRNLLSSPEVGRKLDFLLQEMGREVNTLGSKAQNSQISSFIVDAKATLEKVREQVQNIE